MLCICRTLMAQTLMGLCLNHASNCKYIEAIYFFVVNEVNTKYISSFVTEISVNSLVRNTSEFSDIFKT